MPPLTWISPRASEHESTLVFASRLTPPTRRSGLALLRDSVAIKRQLDRLATDPNSGLVWYELRADLRCNEFWTASAWLDPAALSAFVRADPHAAIMRKRRGTIGEFRSERWHEPGPALPVAPDRVADRLADRPGPSTRVLDPG